MDIMALFYNKTGGFLQQRRRAFVWVFLQV